MLKVVFVGDSGQSYREFLDHDFPDGNEKVLSWTELKKLNKFSSVASPQKNVYMPAGNVSIVRTYFTKFVSFCYLCFLRC